MSRSGRPTVPGSGSSDARWRGEDQRLGQPVALADGEPGEPVQPGVVDGGERGRPGHQQPRAADRRRGLGVGSPAGRRAGGTASAPRTPASRPTPASARASSVPMWCSVPPRRSGPTTPRISPCTWKSGSACTSRSSAVHSHASASASTLDMTRRAGEHSALGRAGGARGVDDERGGVGRRLVRGDGAVGGQVDVDPRKRGERSRQYRAGCREHGVGCRVADHVPQLPLPELRVERHRRDTRQQRRGDADRGVRSSVWRARPPARRPASCSWRARPPPTRAAGSSARRRPRPRRGSAARSGPAGRAARAAAASRTWSPSGRRRSACPVVIRPPCPG